MAHEAAESYNRSDASKEEKDDGRHTLHMESVCVVTQHIGVSSFYVVYHASKQPEKCAVCKD